MDLFSWDLEPADQPSVNRLVVGSQTLKIESFEPLGEVDIRTPSGCRRLHHAAAAEVRCPGGRARYFFGELGGHLVGAREA